MNTAVPDAQDLSALTSPVVERLGGAAAEYARVVADGGDIELGTAVSSATTPLPKAQAARHYATALDDARSGDALLDRVALGASASSVARSAGKPWFIARDGQYSYWSYDVNGGDAWLVVTLSAGTVRAVQLIAKNGRTTALADVHGVAIGQAAQPLLSMAGAHQLTYPYTDAGSLIVTVDDGSAKRLYGTDRSGNVDRIGETQGPSGLPSLIRWYNNSGFAPDRAIPLSAYQSVGEGQYLAREDLRSMVCPSAQGWHRTADATITYAGTPLERVEMQCAQSAYRRAFYFATTSADPHPLNADPIGSAEYEAALSAAPAVAAAPAAMTARTAIAPAAVAPGSIWFTTPAGRCGQACGDAYFQYVDDPAHPFTSISVYLATVGPDGTVYTGPAGGDAVRAGGKLVHASAAPAATPQYCVWGSGIGKCDFVGQDGQHCYFGIAISGTATVQFGPICLIGTGDPWNMPHGPHCDGGSGATGQPVDVVSGKLWRQDRDADLSGPFGLSFMHRYDSDRAGVSADIGYGWRHAYSASLDLTNLSGGAVTYLASDCSRSYLGSLGAGTVSYDSYTGATLTTNSDGTYTVATWDNRTLQFDSSGRLSSLSDRIGNVQTVNRDAQYRISSVVDPLGRSLAFSYDTQNRISTVTSSPSAVSVHMTYDTGTNCYTGDLCSLTESDGAVWSYQYYNPASYGGNHLLMYVYDPLNHVAEYNQYQLLNLGYGDNHYRVTHQEQDSGENARNYSYTAAGTQPAQTVVTDTLGTAHQTTYTWNQMEQQVLSVAGPLCGCNGDTLGYATDAFNRLQNLYEGSSGITTLTLGYSRDVLFTSPDGTTSYTVLAYPGASSTTQYNLPTTAGMSTVSRTIGYYALGDRRQDLIHTITESSVEHPGATVTSTITYSTNGLPTSSTRSGYANGAAATYTVSVAYDARGRVSTITGPRTDVTQQTSFGYYSDTDSDLARRGQLQTITDALGHVSSFGSGASPYNTYSLYGGAESGTDQNGIVWDFTYDARGRRTADIVATTLSTYAYQYDALGRRTAETNPLGNGEHVQYDPNGNPTNVVLTDPSGLQHDQAVISYDSMSRPSGVSYAGCATPASTCTTWNTTFNIALGLSNLDQIASMSSADGGSAAYAYDQFGNPQSLRSGDSSYAALHTTGYGQNHELTTDAIGTAGAAALAFRYDVQGNTSLITPTGSAASTARQFDDFGRLEGSVSPYTGTTTYAYDPAGNVISKTDGNGAVTTVAYDALNRPTSQSSAKAGSTTETVSWTYDVASGTNYGIGRLSSMTDPSGFTSYTYNRRGQINGMSQTANGTLYTTSYTYDTNTNRKTATLPSGRVLSYTYDYADRPSTVSSGDATYVSSAMYEPFGPIAQMNFGNGTTQTWTYTSRYLPQENKVTSPAGTLVDQTYAENAAGLITSITDALNNGYSRTFRYGGSSSYMMAQANTGSALWGVGTMSDAANENLAAQRFSGAGRGYKFTRNQQLQNVFNIGGGGSTAVSYDGAGNESTYGPQTYTYSPRNHLASGNTVSYTYDGWGRRVTATASAGTRTSLYDLDMHLQEESGLSGGAAAYDYVWFAGMPVAQEDVGGQTHWTVTDHLGTPFLQTTSSGATYWQADYLPNGQVWALRTADAHQPLRMPGQEAEEFTTGTPNGLTPRFYNGFRWYEPRLSRYTQADPLGYAGGSWNLYAYAANNPVEYADQDGLLFGDDDAAGALGGALAGLLLQAGHDAATGSEFSPSNYAAAAGAGAIGGVVAVNAAELGIVGVLLSGAAGGAAGSLISQAFSIARGDQCSFDLGAVALDAGIGAATAGIGRGISRALRASSRSLPNTLYRGVTAGRPGYQEPHPGYEAAIEGNAYPRGGSATPMEHNIGNTASPYTSWSTDRLVAVDFATLGGQYPGIVLEVDEGAVQGRMVTSPDLVDESEVLIEGPVFNARVTYENR